MRCASKQRALHGMTLIELLIVLAITGILLAVGVPAMGDFIDRNRVAAQVNELLADIALTRSEATARRGRVGLCASADAMTCLAGAWNVGWIVFVDNGPPATAGTRDPAEPIIRSHVASGGAVSTTLDAANAGTFVGFRQEADGTILDSAGAAVAGVGVLFHIRGSSNSPHNYRTVCLNPTGRSRSVPTNLANPDGTVC